MACPLRSDTEGPNMWSQPPPIFFSRDCSNATVRRAHDDPTANELNPGYLQRRSAESVPWRWRWESVLRWLPRAAPPQTQTEPKLRGHRRRRYRVPRQPGSRTPHVVLLRGIPVWLRGKPSGNCLHRAGRSGGRQRSWTEASRHQPALSPLTRLPRGQPRWR